MPRFVSQPGSEALHITGALMKILVTGISGRIGANLAKALIEAGYEVRGLVWTKDLKLKKLEGLPVELIEGSLVEPADVSVRSMEHTPSAIWARHFRAAVPSRARITSTSMSVERSTCWRQGVKIPTNWCTSFLRAPTRYIRNTSPAV